jgi:hypothetical protein
LHLHLSLKDTGYYDNTQAAFSTHDATFWQRPTIKRTNQRDTGNQLCASDYVEQEQACCSTISSPRNMETCEAALQQQVANTTEQHERDSISCNTLFCEFLRVIYHQCWAALVFESRLQLGLQPVAFNAFNALNVVTPLLALLLTELLKLAHCLLLASVTD